jgi:hypothetical protein
MKRVVVHFRERSRRRRVAALAAKRRRSTAEHWLRRVVSSALAGAGFVAAYALLRLAFGVGRGLDTHLVSAIARAIIAGAVGGLAYGTLGVPLRDRGSAGPYLAAAVAGLGYAIGLAYWVIPALDDARPDGIATTWIGIAIVTVGIGGVLGNEFEKTDTIKRLEDEPIPSQR